MRLLKQANVSTLSFSLAKQSIFVTNTSTGWSSRHVDYIPSLPAGEHARRGTGSRGGAEGGQEGHPLGHGLYHDEQLQ